MGRDVVSAKLDIIFKKLFSDENNKDLLTDFVSGILEIPLEDIADITVTNAEMPPESLNSKFCRLDLNLKTANELINIEIQVRNEQDYSDRTLFYWAKLYTSELKSGDDYKKIKKAIAVNIINFNMFETPNYHNEVQAIVKETGKVFSDKFSIHFFELKKVNKRLNPTNRRDLWLQFLNADKEEEFEMIKQTDTVMAKAVNVIYDMSEDTKIREAARLREKIMRDEASALGKARREGIEKGRKEERNEFIEAMRDSGYPEDKIQDLLKRIESKNEEID